MIPTTTTAVSARRRTAVYFAGFITLGLALSIIGPTLPALAENTGTQLSQIGFLFTARALGGLAGSPVNGRLYDTRPGHAVLSVMLLFMAAMLALVPVMGNFYLLVLVVFVLGFAEIALDIGGNTLLVWLHGKRVGPYMNALHFFFGVGAFVAPLLLAQMLSWNDGPVGVRWTYWIIALLLLPVALWVWRLPSPRPQENGEEAENDRPVSPLLVGLLALFFLIYVGAEVSFGGWIFTYAVDRGLATAVNAAYLTSLFWGALMIGRLISIPVARWLRPQTVLGIGLAGCLVSVGLLLALPDAPAALWGCAFGLGLFMAPIFPTTLSFAERRMPITGRVNGIFFIGATLGGMSIPWLMGQVFGRVDPVAFIWLLALNLLVAAGVFLALVMITRSLGRPGS